MVVESFYQDHMVATWDDVVSVCLSAGMAYMPGICISIEGSGCSLYTTGSFCFYRTVLRVTIIRSLVRLTGSTQTRGTAYALVRLICEVLHYS